MVHGSILAWKTGTWCLIHEIRCIAFLPIGKGRNSLLWKLGILNVEFKASSSLWIKSRSLIHHLLSGKRGACLLSGNVIIRRCGPCVWWDIISHANFEYETMTFVWYMVSSPSPWLGACYHLGAPWSRLLKSDVAFSLISVFSAEMDILNDALVRLVELDLFLLRHSYTRSNQSSYLLKKLVVSA